MWVREREGGFETLWTCCAREEPHFYRCSYTHTHTTHTNMNLFLPLAHPPPPLHQRSRWTCSATCPRLPRQAAAKYTTFFAAPSATTPSACSPRAGPSPTCCSPTCCSPTCVWYAQRVWYGQQRVWPTCVVARCGMPRVGVQACGWGTGLRVRVFRLCVWPLSYTVTIIPLVLYIH